MLKHVPGAGFSRFVKDSLDVCYSLIGLLSLWHISLFHSQFFCTKMMCRRNIFKRQSIKLKSESKNINVTKRQWQPKVKRILICRNSFSTTFKPWKRLGCFKLRYLKTICFPDICNSSLAIHTICIVLLSSFFFFFLFMNLCYSMAYCKQYYLPNPKPE